MRAGRARGSRKISKDVRAVANIALNVRDVSTDDQTTGNERRKTSTARYLIRDNKMNELERKRGTPDAVVREEWNGETDCTNSSSRELQGERKGQP